MPNPVSWFPHPFTFEHEWCPREADEPLSDTFTRILDGDVELLQCLHVTVDGVPVPHDRLSIERPHDEAVIAARLVPRGGGGGGGGKGGGGKSIGSIIAGIVLVVVGVVTQQYWLAFAGASLALGGLAQLLAPSPDQFSFTPPKHENNARLVSSITGVQNRANPYGVIPKVYGTIRYFPPLGARPYTEIVGNDQYLRMVLIPGYKPLDIDQADIRIGDTPLSSFEDVEVEIHSKDSDPDITLATASVIEEPLSVLLTQASGFQQRTTAPNTSRISLDFFFLRGLIQVDSQGNTQSKSVDFVIEYKLTTSGIWLSQSSPTFTDANRSTVRRNVSWDVTPGQYDVQVKRATGDSTSNRISDECTWTMIRSIQAQDAIKDDDVAKIALRIRASEQLNGTIDRMSIIAKARYQVWNGAAWVEQQSNLAAWAYTDQLIDTRSNVNPLATSRLDVDEFEDWATVDAATFREYNAVHDQDETQYDSLQRIAAAGRASFHIKDGQFSVVRDKPQTTPVAILSDRNSWDYQGRIVSVRLPHALRVQFLNKNADYQQDERIVYRDGFDVNNATDFEEYPIKGAATPEHAYTEGRYRLATLQLRPEVHSRNVDFEHLRFNRGDLIRMQASAALIGLSTARVSAVQTSGANVTGVTLDDPVLMETGKNYGLDFQLSDGTRSRHDILFEAGIQSTVVFASPIGTGQTQPAVGDLVIFGEADKETIPVIVSSIESLEGLNVRVSAVDAAPAVHTADSPIPAWVSNISTTSPFARKSPPVPLVVAINSDEFVMEFSSDGSLRSRIVAALSTASQFQTMGLYYQGAIRQSGVNGSWRNTGLVPIETGEIIFENVKDGVSYDLRFRTVNGIDQASAWTTVHTETVIGKTSPPPDVDTFMIERQADGTRRYAWTYLNPPPDLAGFRFKAKLGTGHTWEDLDPLLTDQQGTNLIQASPWENNLLAAGLWTIGIKAQDTSGNLSTNAILKEVTLAQPRIGGAILQRDEHFEGFPGTKTNCRVDENGDLYPIGTETWDDLGVAGITWDTFFTYNPTPSNPITYETPVIDLGALLSFNLLVTVQGQGTPTITESHSDDGMAYSAFTPITDQIEAQYIKIKVVMDDSGSATPTPTISNIIVIPDGTILEEIISDLDMSTISGGSAGARRIPITKTFSIITDVNLTLQGSVAGWSWAEADRDPILGPLVNVWNAALTPSDATVNVTVKGIA